MDSETKALFAEQAVMLKMAFDLAAGNFSPPAGEDALSISEASVEDVTRLSYADLVRCIREATGSAQMPAAELTPDLLLPHSEFRDSFNQEWELLLKFGRLIRQRMAVPPSVTPVAFWREMMPNLHPFYAELALAALDANERDSR